MAHAAPAPRTQGRVRSVQARRRRRIGVVVVLSTNLLVRSLVATRLLGDPRSSFSTAHARHRRTAEKSPLEWSPAETELASSRSHPARDDPTSDLPGKKGVSLVAASRISGVPRSFVSYRYSSAFGN